MPVHPLTNVMPGVQRRIRHAAAGVEKGDAGDLQVAYAAYDFAVDGGLVSTIGLIGSLAIPSGAIIVGGLVEVTTLLTSGGAATAGLQVESAGDLVAATVVSGAPWSTTGRKSIIPVMTGATAIKLTAARDISLVIGAFALTAGVFGVYLYYLDPTANY